MLPKLVLTDIDGVWTDCGMYYDEKGNELKKFNTYDSAGVLFCKLLDIPFGIITGENVKSVERRAKKLKADYLFLGAKNKLEIVKNLAKELIPITINSLSMLLSFENTMKTDYIIFENTESVSLVYKKINFLITCACDEKYHEAIKVFSKEIFFNII